MTQTFLRTDTTPRPATDHRSQRVIFHTFWVTVTWACGSVRSPVAGRGLPFCLCVVVTLPGGTVTRFGGHADVGRLALRLAFCKSSDANLLPALLALLVLDSGSVSLAPATGYEPSA